MSDLVPVRAWITQAQHDRLVAHSKATGRTLSMILAARATCEPTAEMLVREASLAADLEARRTAGRSKGGATTKGRPWSGSRKRRVKSDPGKK